MVRTDQNRLEWMNETWGPLIKDRRNGKPAKTCKGDGRRGSSSLQRLTPQYSKRKRRGNTPPEDLPPPKRSKKRHEERTAPGSDKGQKKLVLLPPKSPVPDGRSCVRCGGLSRSFSRLVDCFKCHRAAFCGHECRKRQAKRPCSSSCASETNPNHHAEDEGISSGSAAPSSGDKTDVEMEDEPGSSGESDSDSDATPSPDRDEFGDPIFMEAGDWEILDFEISKSGLVLNYILESPSTDGTTSYAAEYMFGRGWDRKIFRFWQYNEEAAKTRATIERPFGDVDKEPGSRFSRSILSARFDDDRHIDFNIRDFEERELDEDSVCTEFQLAALLGPEWNEAIESYWEHVRIKLDWDRRAEMIGRMGLVPLSPLVESDIVDKSQPGLPWYRESLHFFGGGYRFEG